MATNPPDPLRAALKTYFGHREFRAGQEQAMRSLLEGRSALAIFPTGAGKSLCYQLPALLLPGLTLVISPLIALMKDQVDGLQKRGIAAARLDSTLSLEESGEIYRQLRNGELKLLFLAPERLLSAKFMEMLGSLPVELMAVDEAHCISEWGHNFRPEYLRLARIAKKLRVPRVLALTATATPAVAEEIAAQFEIEARDCFRTDFHRPNLFLRVSPLQADERLARLISTLQTENHFPAIVYATLQETTETVARALTGAGIKARAYHAGLGDEVRAAVQEGFMEDRVEVIVATIAFGMGVDKADIRSVFHYNLPKTLENYQQEIGRAGRDGQPSHCEMLACADDLIVLENFILGDTPEETGLRTLVDHLLRQGPDFDLSRYDLSRSFDIRPLVLETVLTYLEQDDLIEPVGSFYSTFRIRLLQTESQILNGHTPARQKFLGDLFTQAKRGRIWLTLDVEEASRALDEPRERIMRALNFLEEAGDIELRPLGLRHQFRLLENAASQSPRAIADRLLVTFRRREERDLLRLEEVVRLATDPACTTNHLLRYFGEDPATPCGHCQNCCTPSSMATHPSVALPAHPSPPISLDDLAAIARLRDEKHPALRSPRQLTRFLCGLSSPAVNRERLTRHDTFGLLARVPFRTVLAQVTSNHF